MANISVSELLFDPDFVDQCIVIRNEEIVGDDGVATYTEHRIPIVASIQPSSGDVLDINPDLIRTGGTYEIITTFPLVTATDVTKSDSVIWRETEFTVISVARFGNFGGQYEGVMRIKTISPGV